MTEHKGNRRRSRSILKYISLGLVSLGILAGIMLFLLPFPLVQRAGLSLRGPLSSFLLLFFICIIVGSALFALVSKEEDVKRLLEISASILLILGIISGLRIVLVKINLLEVTETASSWCLFLFCILLGAGCRILAEDISDEIKGRASATDPVKNEHAVVEKREGDEVIEPDVPYAK
jgi:hypothetical protein